MHCLACSHLPVLAYRETETLDDLRQEVRNREQRNSNAWKAMVSLDQIIQVVALRTNANKHVEGPQAVSLEHLYGLSKVELCINFNAGV